MDRPRCSCGNLCKPNGISKVTGEPLYCTYCRSCARAKHGDKRKEYTLFKKDRCEECGFIPKHSCQLDVDHIDGNHKNNKLSNLQTLCANCHRLKTFINKDWQK